MTPTRSPAPRSPHAHPLPVLGLYAALLLVLVGLSIALVDGLLPETRTRTATVLVEASPRAAWSLLARVDRYPAWRERVERVAPLPGPTAPDSTAPDPTGPPRSRSGPDPGLPIPPDGWVEEDRRGSRVRYRVVEADPPELLVLEVREGWPAYHGRRVVRLTPENGGTRIAVGERGSVAHPLSRVADRYLASAARDPRRLARELAERLRRR